MPASQDEKPAPDLTRTLILAPLRKDANYIAELLAKNALPCEICEDSDSLEAALGDTPGLLITTHEALRNGTVDIIAEHVRNQPDWSELPVIVLLDKASRTTNVHAALSERWPRARLVFYHRPVTALELLSGIQSLLLSRLRQRDVRDHLERELELRRELNHRVKNILASVLSIVRLTRRSAKSFDDMSRDLEERLTALAEVHSAVFRAGGETVDFASVVATTIAPYRNGGGISRVAAKGPPLTISRDAATALALSLHELVTNALKYGALSAGEGAVSLTWSVTAGKDPEFRLEWVENGGPQVVPPARTGYGTRYLRAALSGLLGREPAIEFRKTGLRFAASGPVSRLVDGR
jgi:two-component sensor histidine kinase